MKRYFAVISYLIFVVSNSCLAQNKVDSTSLQNHQCLTPVIYHLEYDTATSLKSVANYLGDEVITYVDSLTSSLRKSTIVSDEIQLSYNSLHNSSYIQLTLNDQTLFISFGENGFLEQVVNLVEPCSLKIVNYSKQGFISEIFVCDYGQANNCISTRFIKGVRESELYCTPFYFTGIEDYNRFNVNCQVRQVVPLKEVTYDNEGEIILIEAFELKMFMDH